MNMSRCGWWAALPAAILLLACALAIYGVAIKARANAILKDVASLKVGVSSKGQLDTVAARHKSSIVKNSCAADRCTVWFQVYNTWLYLLKLEPVARFFVSVDVKDGIVSCIDVSLSRDTRVFPTSPSAGQTLECITPPKFLAFGASPPYWFPTPVGKPYLFVALTAKANAIQRQHAYQYSFWCLVKPGAGCELPCDYLPLAWRDWQAELERQGFGVGGFGPFYPNRSRCPTS